MKRQLVLALASVFFCGRCYPQVQLPKVPDAPPPNLMPQDTGPPPPSRYILGPDDQIALLVPALADDFSDKTFRIDLLGDVSLPVVGSLHAGGRTVEAIQDEVKNRLGPILQDPDVVINVVEFASQPVSILGAVTNPGIRQLQGHKSLFEVLSLAGGLSEDAGTTVKITRNLKYGPIPLSDAATSSTGQFSVANVKVKNIVDASEENIMIMPGDTIFVPKANLVYAVGSVVKPGGFPIGENESVSALQVVALAEGLQKTAAPGKARILRALPGTSSRTEIPVNIKMLMAGKTQDVPLLPNDILFIPNSGVKTAEFRTIDAIVAVAIGTTIYGKVY